MADLPDWDDLPAPSGGNTSQSATPPAWDDLPASSPDDSSAIGAFARGAAHGAAPAIGGVLSGVATGALAGSLGAGPVGTVVGGLAGGIAGGAAIEKGEDWLLDKLGWQDKAQDQADQEQHGTARMLGEMAPAAVTLRPSGSLAQRAIGAAVGGVGGAASDLINNGEITPSSVLSGAAMGAAMPNLSRLGEAAEGAGARLGSMIKGKPSAAAQPAATPPPASRDLKQTDDLYTAEPPPASPAKQSEWTIAQEALSSMAPGDPMRPHYEAYLDQLSKADKQPSGEATPSVSPRVSYGVSEVAAAPSQDPTVPGNQTGAPMLQRVGARTSDPTRDYRKNATLPSDGQTTQESVPLSTAENMHEDVAAALQPTEPQTSFAQQGIQQPAQQPPGHIETGIPQRPPAPPPGPDLAGIKARMQGNPPVARKPQPGEAGFRDNVPMPGAKPAPQPPADDAALVQQATQRAMRRPIVEALLPEGMNSSQDPNGPIYAHPNVPQALRRFGAIHETVEGDLMRAGKMYPEAHKIATEAEEGAVQREGIDLPTYKQMWKDVLSTTKDAPGDPRLQLHVPSQEALGHYDPTTNPNGAKDVTAAVRPEDQAQIDAVRKRLTTVGYNKALEAFNAMSPEDQLKESPKFFNLTENTRAPRTSETGVGVRSKAHQARIDNSTTAVKQAVSELPESTLSLERNAANKAAIIDHATDLFERSKELYGDKDPTKFVKGDETSGYMPTQPSPAHNLVSRARKIALAAKPTWATLEDYVHAVALKGETGQNVDAGIAMSKRPTVENAEAGAQEKSSTRPTHPDFDNTSGDESQVYADQQGKLRDWLNNLSDADHATVMKANPDLETEINTTQDPEELKRNYMDDVAETSGKRPPKIELVPAEDVEGGKRTRITSAADLARFAPTEAGAKASEGKSLKGSPEYEALAAKYGGGKVATPEEAAAAKKANNRPLPTTWDKATEALNDFVGNEHGGMGGNMMKGIADWWSPQPNNPTNPAKSPAVSQHIEELPTWVKAYANQRGEDKLQLRGNAVKAMADDLTPEQWKHIQSADTAKEEASLPAKELEAYKEDVLPLKTEGDATYARILDKNKTLGLNLNLEEMHPGFDNRNTPRMRVDEDVTDKENSNVISGNRYSDMADSLRPREHMGLLDQATGKRMVLHRGDDDKFSLLQNGKVTPLTKLPSNFEGKVGDTLPLYSGGKKSTFTVDHASEDEIEAATAGKTKFVRNPVITYSNRLNQLQNVEANIDLIQKIKDDPRWAANTTTDPKVAVANGWDQVSSKLDALGKRDGKTVYMPNTTRWILDDMFHQGFSNPDADVVAQLGNVMARTFLSTGAPIHVGNMATNWAISRGFDNITPRGLKNLGVYGVRAFKSMMDPANSKDYLDFLQAGGRPQFHNTITHDLIPTMMKEFGVDIGKTPSKYDPIAKIWGISTPDLIKAVEHFSTREMWRMGDMFSMQRFLELRDGQGMDPKAAADEVNKFASYDTGPTFGFSGHVGRIIQQVMVDPKFALFGRWHMLLMRSMAHVTRNVFGDSTKEQRIQGVGQMMAAAGLMYAVYPAVDKALQAISGNPDAEMGRRGMLAVTDGIKKVLAGDADYSKIVGTLATPSIPINMGMQALRNQTWTGKPIVEPREMNTARNVGSAVGEFGDWAAGSAIPPYGTIASNLTKGQGVLPTAGKFVAGMVGAKIPSPGSQRYEAHEQQINARAQKAHERHPGGPLEELGNTLPGR